MATTVHIPDDLLAEIDRLARSLNISRSRLVVRALRREIAARADWSPGFFEALGAATEQDRQAADEMLAAIQATRRSKGPVEL
jgi:predicted transcriptional regulator